MPQASAPLLRRGRRIDRDHDALQRRRRRDAAVLDLRARPQRVGALLDDLAVDLLAAEPRAVIARQHVIDESRRQIDRHWRCVPACVTAVRRIGDQPLDQRDRPRRGGDHLPRPLAKAQSELQHVEGCFGMTPLGELVRPGGGKLRAAQALRIFRRKHLRDRAVRPFQPPARRNPVAAARRARCTASRPETPSIITSRASCSVSPISAMRACGSSSAMLAHPFGAGAGLAGAAPAEDQPGGPVVRRCWRARARVGGREQTAENRCGPSHIHRASSRAAAPSSPPLPPSR